eukprot:4129586-Lingulodinium_polyedra.AAC.1
MPEAVLPRKRGKGYDDPSKHVSLQRYLEIIGQFNATQLRKFPHFAKYRLFSYITIAAHPGPRRYPS